MLQQCFKLPPGTEFFYNDPRRKNCEVKLHVPNWHDKDDPFIVIPETESDTRVYWTGWNPRVNRE